MRARYADWYSYQAFALGIPCGSESQASLAGCRSFPAVSLKKMLPRPSRALKGNLKYESIVGLPSRAAMWFKLFSHIPAMP